MGKIMIINGSPRAPKSNSKRYAEIFAAACNMETQYFAISKTNREALCKEMEGYSDLLLVFPLYADGLPVTLLHFLKVLENCPPAHKPVISVLINCGFLECHQNDVAVQMIALFCKKNGYRMGAVLKIASGEAILNTPFRAMAVRKIQKLAKLVAGGRYETLQVTMPLPRRWFIKASTRYWKNYGEKNGVNEQQMRTMQIEGQETSV